MGKLPRNDIYLGLLQGYSGGCLSTVPGCMIWGKVKLRCAYRGFHL